MCPPIVLAAAAIAASIGGAIYSASVQQNAAKDAASNSLAAAQANYASQQEIAQINAEQEMAIAEANALADQRISTSNAEAVLAAAESENRIAEANALRFDRAADAERAAGEQEEARQRTRSRFLLADQRARYGASGVTIEGSALEVLAFSAGQEELDARTIRYNTGTRVNDLTMQAASTRLEGSLGVQDAGLRARNLLADSITRGETGMSIAQISGQAGQRSARLSGQASLTNAGNMAGTTRSQGRTSATNTLVAGVTSAVSSSSAGVVGGAIKKAVWG